MSKSKSRHPGKRKNAQSRVAPRAQPAAFRCPGSTFFPQPKGWLFLLCFSACTLNGAPLISGDAMASMTLTVQTAPDAAAEAEGIITDTVAVGVGYAVGDPATARGTLIAHAVAVIGGMTTGNVTEDAVTDVATGTLTAVDPDPTDPDNTFQPMLNTAGTYGIFTLAAGGDWTYTLDNTPDDAQGDATNALAAGDTMEDVFPARSIDGTQATVTIRVTGANDAPTAGAGSPQTVPQGSMVTLIGTGSDPDTGDDLTYQWTQTGGTPTVTLADGQIRSTATFTTPTVTAGTTLTFELTVTDSSGEMATDTVSITIDATSEASTINLGTIGRVVEDSGPDTVTGTLTVTAPGGAVGTFRSQMTIGTYGTFTLATSGDWTYTLDNRDRDTNALIGTQDALELFPIRAADNTPATLIINVLGTNDLPTAEAGVSRSVNEDAVVTLTGTGTDVDAGDQEVLNYRWTQTGGSPTVLFNVDTAMATFTAPNLTANTILTFTLTVIDRQLGTATATVTITVIGTNDPAVISGDLAGSVTEGTVSAVSGRLIVSDPEGADTFQVQPPVIGTYGTFTLDPPAFDNVEWSYRLGNTPGNAQEDATNALAAGQEGIDAFTVTAADDTEATVTITVTGTNDAPTATVVGGAVRFAPQGALVTLVGRGDDPDTGDSLTYAWTQTGTPVVALMDADTATATFTTPPVATTTTLMFELTVTDPQNARDTATVTVTVQMGNTVADISGALTGALTEDAVPNTVTGMLTVTDLTDPTINFTVQRDSAGSYGSFTLANSGAWTYTLDNTNPAVQALAADAEVTDAFLVLARDNTPATVTITITGVNDAPTADVGGVARTVDEGDLVTLDGTGSRDPEDDSNNVALTYEWTQTGGTPTVTLTDADSATPTFTAPDDRVSERDLTFSLTVTDSAGDTDTTTVIITITADNDPAVIGGALTGEITEDAVPNTVSGMLAVSDPDGPDMFDPQTGSDIAVGTYGTFSLTDAGAWTYTLDNTPGDVQGDATNALAATQEEIDAFTVTTSDGTTATVTITITGVNDEPTSEVIPSQTLAVGEPSITLDVAAYFTDPDGSAALTYAVTSSDVNFVTADISGSVVTLTVVAMGDTTVTVTATDAGGQMTTADIPVTVGLSSNARLRGLSLSMGVLSPTFDPGTTTYQVRVIGVNTLTVMLTVTPTAAHSGARITVNGMPADSGSPSGPIVLESETEVRVEVTAPDGSTMRYLMRIVRPTGAARTAALNEQILPRIIPAVLDGSNQLIIDRLRRHNNSVGRSGTAAAGNSVGDSGESPPADLMQLGQWLYDGAAEVALIRQLQRLDEFELRKFIGDLSFDADGERIGMDGTALYGGDSYRQLSGGEDGMDWDGDLIGGYVGIDKWLQADMLVGISVSYFKGEFDYDDADRPTVDGKYDVDLTGVHSYIGWSVDDLDVWASIGYGTGEAELVDSAGQRSSDLEYGAVSVGAAGRLYASDELIAGGRSALRLRGEASFWQLEFDRNGGDGQSGQGIELGGSVEWRDAKRGLTLSGSGRVLTLAEYNEWGLSGELRVESKSDGRGLSLSLSPSYGRDGSSIGRLWSDGASAMSNAGQSGSADMRMDGEVGYGVWALGGTVRPYLGASLLGGGGHTQRLGVRFEFGRGVRMELEGGRRAGANAEAEHNIQLRWKWDW